MASGTASGSSLDTKNLGMSKKSKLWNMVDGITASTDNGAWIDTHDFDKGSLEFFNQDPAGAISSFSCQLMGSNAPAMPANSADGFAIGAAVTALGGLAISTPARFLKVKTTALSVTSTAKLGVRLHGFTY